MADQTASIRELRTDFRSVKRKLEQYGSIVITDHGQPAYVLQPLPRHPVVGAPLPDYYARLRQRQPTPLSEVQTQELWEEERGDR
jgi:antitoxin (DNA-binding transcriptional repressor) of toxin-antitoxin stability system